MAKKKTERPEQEDDIPTRGKPYGIYLNLEILTDLEQIAEAETGGSLHTILQYAIKYFIREYKAGKVKLKKETVTRLKFD
jgi:hypothetical protein